ncbi:MAG: hypothetical protein PHQ26_04010 [Bacteroidales bacterium]|jgi:hypothetical protein|nr:hypothetical protein [Bacteroidales bacterium]MDD3167220.1 hypothetical protein [Bacteroidales bacterium]MDD4770629.1 hypothetical protein [Bacteroidales bacterium]HKL91689.1 hypothetical protein [Bacteroidales bacterium]
MFGIPDPGVWLAYVLEIACLLFAAWYGIRYWNQDDTKNEHEVQHKNTKK